MQNSLIILISFLIGCTSCATIFNSQYSNVDIHTSEASTLLINGDTVDTKSDVFRLRVMNQKKVIDLYIETDSTSKVVGLKPQNSFAYNMNVFLMYGIGYIFEADKPKRYTYPKSIYVDLSNPENDYVLYAFPEAGDFYFKFSLPLVNSFLLQPPEVNGIKTSYGYWGIGGELEYFYKKNQSFRFSLNYATNNRFFQVQSYSVIRFQEKMNSFYISLSKQHQIKRFSIGYGLSYINQYWNSGDFFESTLNSSVSNIEKKSNSIGFVFPANVQLDEKLFLGLTYRPSFFQTHQGNSKFIYEHLLSVDIAWKFRLN